MNDYLQINHLSLILTKDKISKMLNAEIKQRINQDNPLKIELDESKSINLYTSGDLTFDFRDSYIYLGVPMKISAQLDFPVGSVSVDAQIKVFTKTKIDIRSDFLIDTASEITNIDWISGPDIQPKLMDILVPDSLVRNAINKHVPELSGKIDEVVNKLLLKDNLTNKIKWERIFTITLEGGQHLFFRIRPEFIEIEKVKNDLDKLTLAANCKCFFEATTQLEEVDNNYKPTVQYLENPLEEITRIYLTIELAHLSDLLMAVVKSTDKIEGAIKSKVDRVIVRQIKTDGLAVAVKLSGALNGGLSIVGIPVYNRELMTLDFENINFDFTGTNILSGIAGNVALSIAKSYIKKQFPINLEPIFESLINQVNEDLDKIQFNQNIGVSGEITHFEIEDFMIENGYLTVTLGIDLGMMLI